MSNFIPLKKIKPSLLLILSLLTCIPSMAYAEDPSDQDELENLLSLLSEQTTLATNSRLNIDFVPGMISVMTGEEMRQKGFLNVWEAVSFLPGLHKQIDATGMRSIIVRGLGRSQNAPKVKLLLNNIAINSSSTSTTGTLLDTPTDQVERIEFIRGPGSAIHGEFAFAGVLNVITKQQGTDYGLRLGSHQSTHLHGLIDFAQAPEWLSGSLNISVSESDGEGITAGPDRTPLSYTGYAPGPVNNKWDNISMIADMRLSDIDLSLQYQQGNRGDHFGKNNYLPPDHKQTVISDTVASVHIGKAFNLTDRVNGNWSLNHVRNDTDKHGQFLGIPQIYGGTNIDADIVSDVSVIEHRNEAKLDLSYQSEHHTLFLQLSATEISLKEFEQFINLDPVTQLPDNQMNAFPTPINPGYRRNINSLVLQDEFAVHESTTMTTGLRYDDYDDIGANLSPRLAMVWRVSNSDILKIQYAEAFRPPSLLETNGAIYNHIDPETINTLETSYIFNTQDFLLRNTLYFSDINDLIVYQDTAPFGYKNLRQVELSGYELEIEKRLGHQWKLGTNLTLQNSGKASEDVYLPADWILSASIDYQIDSYSSFNGVLQSVSELDRLSTDNRDSMASISQFDMTYQQRFFLGVNGLQFNITMKNLLGEEIRYTSPPQTYQDDYLFRQAPSVWLELNFNPV